MDRVGELLAALCHEDDRAFMLRVEEQLHRFTSEQLAEESENVIVFPPFTGHHRFLVHLVAERFQLHSNSSGYGQDRTTTVSVGKDPPYHPHLSLADLIPAQCAWERAGWVEAPNPRTETRTCGRGSRALYEPLPAQKPASQCMQECAAADGHASQHTSSPEPTMEPQSASRSGDSRSRCLLRTKSCDKSQRKRQIPRGVYQPPQRRGAGHSPVSTPPVQLHNADGCASEAVSASTACSRIVRGRGSAHSPRPPLLTHDPPGLDPHFNGGASPTSAPDGLNTGDGYSVREPREPAKGSESPKVTLSAVEVDWGPWEAERQRTMAEEREGLYGRLMRYAECSGRGHGVWHRSWRLHEINNGVVQFSVPSSALENISAVRIVLSAHAPAAGGRGRQGQGRQGQGRQGGTRSAVYEVVLDWDCDACTVRRTKPGAWNEPVQELWAKTSALSKLALREADTACVIDTNLQHGRSLLTIQAGCTQAWWVAVRNSLVVVGSGSVVGAGITIVAQDTNPPLPVQVVGFHCNERPGREHSGRSDVTLRSINFTWPLARCAAHLGHILLLKNWQRCMNKDGSMDCESLTKLNSRMDCSLSCVREWIGKTITKHVPACDTSSVDNGLQETTYANHLSMNVKIVDSEWAWVICASLLHAQKILMGASGKYDADCSMHNSYESAGVAEATCVDTPSAYPAWHWVGVCPPEILMRAGFIAAKARPATSATVANRLICNAITR